MVKIIVVVAVVVAIVVFVPVDVFELAVDSVYGNLVGPCLKLETLTKIHLLRVRSLRTKTAPA